MKNKILLFVTLIFLIAPVFLIEPAQKVSAGQIGTQTGAPVTPTPREGGRYLQEKEKREQRQLAAAQFRNAQNPPPGGRSDGGEAWARSGFSYFSSIFLMLGGIWALIVLLRQRLVKRSPNRRIRLPRFCDFALKPSSALSAFGFLFVSVIAGSLLTKPTAVTAEKRDARDKRMMTGFQNPSNEPVFKTAQQIGGSGITQIGSPVFDTLGNRYVRGGFTGTLTIGATTLTASRDFDGFVAKYDAMTGEPVWVRQASGATSAVPATLAVEGATALAVDSTGNVYIGGSFVKTIVLQGGANSITLNDNGAAGVNYESFVAKYNADGDLLWAKGGNSGSPKNADNLEIGQNAINQIVIDASDNPYVSGLVSGNSFFGATFAGSGETEILLAKLDPLNGTPAWTKIIGGTADDNALDLKIDNAGNLYLIGNFGSQTVMFPTTPATTLSNPDDEESATDTFIAKFDSNGANLWVKSLGNDEVVGGSAIAVTGAGEIYLTGYFFDSATFPTTPNATTLIETEGGSEDEEEASLGGYLTKIDTNGNFVWAKGFGGLGEAIALDAAGRIYIVGTFWDGGTFGSGETNEESLASFGGEDLYVARFDSNGNFDFAKPIAATGLEGVIAIGNPTGDGKTENNYNPLGIAFNPVSGTMFVAGEFQNAIALDCITLTTPGSSVIQSYLAEISDDAGTCRIWNGLDVDDNDFDSPANWNGGVLPSQNDSVYVPYTGNNFDAPDFNPATNISLTNLSIADDRILTLEKNLNVTTRLDLLGGFIDADTFTVSLNAFAQALSVNEGRVIGKVQKQFFFGDPFTFPVGTANGYSPVTLSNINSGKGGSFTVVANEGAYPFAATDLPTNRAARWWNLTNGGLVRADLTFQYVDGDIAAGDENLYRAYRIPPGGGAATRVPGSIDTASRIVSAPNVTAFSDWTLAQAPPTAASVAVGGRVTTAGNRGIARAFVTMTDEAGNQRTALTNSFGFYRFANVPAGASYVFAVNHKRYNFDAATQVQFIAGERDDINFAALP